MTAARRAGRPRAVLAKATRHERALARQKIGRLENLRIKPATAARYVKAVQGFFRWCQALSIRIPFGDLRPRPSPMRVR